MSIARSSSIFLLTCAAAFAQPPQPPGVPAPGEGQPPAGAPDLAPPAAQVAAARAALDQADVPLPERAIVEDIIEPKLSGNALAGLYRQYTGRRVIVSSAAAAAEFSFVQDASPDDPLTFAQAAELLRKAATIEGFIFVPSSDDPNLDFLTLATGGVRPTGIGVPVYNENDVLPDGDAVISYVMGLDYIKPDEAVRTFTQIIGQFGAFGSIAAVPNAAAVVITENTSLIRKLIDLKVEIDKPSSQVATRFIKVQYADVTELATVLNELLNTQQSTQRSAGVQRAGSPAAAAPPGGDAPQVPGAAAEGGGSSGEETPVQIIPEPRTNRIVAMGRPVDILFVEGLIREFDTETDQKNFLRRKLHFLTAVDFLPVAENALTRAFSGTGDIAGGGAGGQAGGAGAQGGGRAQTQQRQTTQQTGGFGAGGAGGAFGGGAAGGGGAARGDALSDPGVISAPSSLLVGRTLLVADNITNSIIVQGTPSGLEIIENLLDQLDVKPDQVMISTVFGQLALDDSTSTGVNWLRAFRGNENRGVAGSVLSNGVAIVSPDSLTDLALGGPNGFPSASGLSLYGRIGRSLGAYVNLLQNNSDFTILSRPSIFISNNQRGTISSGRRIAIPTNSNQFTGGGVSTNIEYRDVVLKLEVIPLINSDEEITLTISLVNDEIVGASEDIVGIGSVPIIGTREIFTNVTVPNNETVVLGGLITTNDTDTVSGVPILSSIPGLGRLFSTKTTGVERTELMIFIQPSIINGSRSLEAVQNDMDARYQVSDEVRALGDGPGVLPPPDNIYPLDDKTGASIPVTPPRARPVPASQDPRNSAFRRFR